MTKLINNNNNRTESTWAEMDFVSQNARTPKEAFADLAPGASVHGLTDGQWSFTDGLLEILERVGRGHLIVSTWTAAQADIRHAKKLLTERRVESVQFLVDRSFEARQKEYCELLRNQFGDDAVRVWDSHAKFALVVGGDYDVLYLTSANLNKNPRVENFSLLTDEEIVGQYIDLVQKVFETQQPGEGFGKGASKVRKMTRNIMDVARLSSGSRKKKQHQKSGMKGAGRFCAFIFRVKQSPKLQVCLVGLWGQFTTTLNRLIPNTAMNPSRKLKRCASFALPRVTILSTRCMSGSRLVLAK